MFSERMTYIRTNGILLATHRIEKSESIAAVAAGVSAILHNVLM